VEDGFLVLPGLPCWGDGESLNKLGLAPGSKKKELYQWQIEATDRQIDTLVYELYVLTEEEIEIHEPVMPEMQFHRQVGSSE